MSSYSPSDSPGFWSEGPPTRSARTSNSKEGEPPRPAKDGWEWVWFPEGYWAERPCALSSRQSSDERNQSQETASTTRPSRIFKWGSSRAGKNPKDVSERPEHTDSFHSVTVDSPPSEAPHPLWQLPKGIPQSPYLSEQEQVAALQQAVSPLSHPRVAGPVVRDTWKSLDAGGAVSLGEVLGPARHSTAPGGNRLSWKPFSKHSFPEESKDVVEEQRANEKPVDTTPSYFNVKPILRPSDHTPPDTPPSAEHAKFGSKRVSSSEPSYEGSSVPSKQPAPASLRAPRGLRRWLTGKLPRGRKEPSDTSTASARSSSRERDKIGPVPDSPASSFIAFNRPVHLPDATQSYPAGVSHDEEAKHVDVPPLKTDTADGKPRSLFIDIRHPDLKHVESDEKSSNTSTDDDHSVRAEPRVFSYRKGQTPEKRQWWDEPKAAVRRDPVKDVSFFEFNMPEHLPTSPMCPAHPMHRGKSRLVCVYHGRSKASMDQTADLAEMLSQAPDGPEDLI